MKVITLYGSSRKNGNSEQLAQRLLENIPHTKRYLMDYDIQPIVDKRHTSEGFTTVDDEYDTLIREVIEHDIIVFVTPLYWYGMSGLMKNFVDRWSQSLRDARIPFKERMKDIKAYVVICGGDNPHVKAMPLVHQFEFIFDFMGMAFMGYLIGEGGKPGEVQKDESALKQAAEMNAVFLRLINGASE